MTQKVKAILYSMLRRGPSTTNIDRFREAFGSWQLYESSSVSDLKYVKNIDKPYVLNDIIAGVTETSKFVVPTTGNTSIPFIEQIYKIHTYKVDRVDSRFPSPQSLIPYDYRFINFAMEGTVRTNPELPTGEDSQATTGLSSTDVEFIYKSENIPFEELATTAYGQERSLPNYYDITLWNRNLSPNNDLETFLRDSLDRYYADPLKGLKKTNLIIPCDNMSLINEGNTYINEQKQNIFTSHEVLDGVATRENTFSQIPYYVHLKLSNDSQDVNPGVGSSTLKEDKKFIRNNIMFFPKETITPTDMQDEKAYDNNYDLSALLSRWHVQNKNILNQNDLLAFKFTGGKVEGREFYTYDLVTWLNQYAPSVVGSLPQDMSTIGIEETACSRMVEPTQTKMVLVQYALKKILNAFSRVDIRNSDGTYENFLPQLYDAKEMIECGGMGINETLFYKIEKFVGDGSNVTPLQTIIIPHSDFGTEYIDTQISYDSLYTYRISEVKAVMYCEYEYKLNSKYTSDSDTAYVDILQYPRIKIVEIPTFSKSGRILANPPNVPEIKILPIRKSKDKFRILFQNSYGSSMGDTNNLLLSNNQVSYSELLSRTTSKAPMILLDDKVSIASFHVFFTTEDQVSKIVSYDDLKDRQLYSSLTDNADSATMKLSIKPNKKYYLSFVALNRLGLASPGTQIYEFKLISDSGLTYLEFKPYVNEIEKEIYKNTKTAHKLISISPSGLQGLLDYLRPEPNESIDLDGFPDASKRKPVSFGGALSDRLFPEAKIGEGKVLGKKMKIRIKSKNTNQTFDVNLHFKHERVESTFDKTGVSTGLTVEPVENPNSGASEIDLLSNTSIPLSLAPLPICVPTNYNFVVFEYPETGTGRVTTTMTTLITDPGYSTFIQPNPNTHSVESIGIGGSYPPNNNSDTLVEKLTSQKIILF